MTSSNKGTRVLMSFGAAEGGFEFAMQLRREIYGKFRCNPDTDLHFCYLDAVSLRDDNKTTYAPQPEYDRVKMNNPDWKSHYQTALNTCTTMILLITGQWLKSAFCQQELGWLINEMQKRRNLQTVMVVWPDAREKLRRDFGDPGRGKGNPNISIIDVAGAEPIRASFVNREGEGIVTGVNGYTYGCGRAETATILNAIS